MTVKNLGSSQSGLLIPKLNLVLFCLVACRAPSDESSKVKITNSSPIVNENQGVVRFGRDCTATFVKPNLAITTAVCAKNNNEIIVDDSNMIVVKAKVFHPFYREGLILSPYNLALLIVPMTRAHFGVAEFKDNTKHLLLGYGCADQDTPWIKGILRKGDNILKSIGQGLLVANGTGKNTSHPAEDRISYSIGCKGDEGSPAFANGGIVGVYVGERYSKGPLSKDAIYAQLSEQITANWIQNYQDYMHLPNKTPSQKPQINPSIEAY